MVKESKKKIALLIDEFFGGAGTAYGGYGFLARQYIAKYIPDENIQIDVLLDVGPSYFFAKKTRVDSVDVYRLPRSKRLARQWLKRQNYDLYLSIEMTYPSYRIMRLIEDKNLILWIQDPRPEKIWQPIRETMGDLKDPCVMSERQSSLVQNLFRQGRVKFISQGVSLNPRAVVLYGLPERVDIKLVPNPIDINYDFSFDISKKKKQVIFLGRLEAQKRAWIFCEVAEKMPEYEFFVMGKFHRDEEKNRKPLERYLNGNIPNLHFMGHMEGAEKEKLIKESRVLLNTSIWEGIPISWLEALQYGTTIVSCLDNESLPSRFGKYVGDILGDGVDQADLFIPAIRELMENDELYADKAQKAVEYMRKVHSVEKFKQDMKQALINLGRD